MRWSYNPNDDTFLCPHCVTNGCSSCKRTHPRRRPQRGDLVVDRRGALALITSYNEIFHADSETICWTGFCLPSCEPFNKKLKDVIVLGPISLMLSSSLDPEAWIMNRLPIRWPLNGF